MVKHVLNILWEKHKNEFKKWKVMIILYVYFLQNWILTPNQKKWMKVDWKKKHNILSLLDFFMSFYICYVVWMLIFKECVLLFNFQSWQLCYFALSRFFFQLTLACLWILLTFASWWVEIKHWKTQQKTKTNKTQNAKNRVMKCDELHWIHNTHS
jgi:hypothetical protein